MAPQKQPVAVDKNKATSAINVPDNPRRNYIPRTYSGETLMKTDKMSLLDMQVAKSPYHFIWNNHQHTVSLPKLTRLDFKMEMKLLDIIFGEDPLNEGTTAQEFDIKRAKIQKQNLDNALSAGKKHSLLREKHAGILYTMQIRIHNVSQEKNLEIQQALDHFLLKWQKQAEHIRLELRSLSFTNVKKIGFEALNLVKSKLETNLRTSGEWITSFESIIEDIESSRANKLFKELTETSNQLKRLNFERHAKIEEMLKKKTAPLNDILIRNRKTILKYVDSLRIIMEELRETSAKYVHEATSNWHSLRYNFIFPQFQQEIEKVLDIDFSGFYSSYQLKFDESVEAMSRHACKILDWKPADGLKKVLPGWKKELEIIIEKQDLEISAFSRDLYTMVNQMDEKCKYIFDHWIPLIQECKVNGEDDMKEIVEKVRKSPLINMGKRAALSLFSKAAKNNFLLFKVIEYVKCISYTTSIFHQVQMLETEAIIAKEQRELHSFLSKEIHDTEILYFAEFQALKTETDLDLVMVKAKKAQNILYALREKFHERFSKSVHQLQSFLEKSKAAHQEYVERLEKLFAGNPKRSRILTDVPPLDKNLFENGGKIPSLPILSSATKKIELADQRKMTPGLVNSTVPQQRLSENEFGMESHDSQTAIALRDMEELQYWPLKVEEWRKDQIILIERMKKNELYNGEAVDSDMLGFSSKKKGEVKERREKIDKELPHLLDGSLLMETRNPVHSMEKLALISGPYIGQFFEFSEKNTEVVEINVIDVASRIKDKREHLFKRVIDDSKTIWSLVLKEIQKKIRLITEHLTKERTQSLASVETLGMELEVAMASRLDQLPKIHQTHKNEARFIIDTIHTMQSDFSQRISQIQTLMVQFQTESIKSFHDKLAKCNSTTELFNLQRNFNFVVENYNYELSDMQEKSNLDFEHGKKMLEKSMQQGFHSSAWAIIKDSGAYDPATLNTELEVWKSTTSDSVQKQQKEVVAEIKLALKEIEFYIVDYEMIEILTSHMKRLKTLLRGETIFSQKRMGILSEKIQEYKDASYDSNSWGLCLDWIAETIDIQCATLEAAQYLSLCDHGYTFTYLSCYRPNQLSWRSWKEKYHIVRSKEKNPNIIHSSEATSRSGSGSSSNLQKQKAPLSKSDEEKALVPNVEKLLSSAPPEIFKSSNSTPQYGSSVFEKVAPPTPTTVTTTPKTTTPYSTSHTPKLPSPKGTPPEPGSRPWTNDFFLPRHSEMQIRYESHAFKEFRKRYLVRNLDGSFKEWTVEARNEIMEHYEKYAPKLKDRDIRKTDQIPPNHFQYAIMVDSHLDKYLISCNEFKNNQTKDFFNNLNNFRIGIELVIGKAFHSVNDFAFEKLGKSWSDSTAEYLELRGNIKETKQNCLAALKTSLGHPTMTVQLSELDQKAKESNIKMKDLIERTNSKTLERLERVTIDFVGRIAFLSILMSDIGANWITRTKRNATPPSSADVPETLNLSMLPFSSIRDRFKDIPIASPSSEFQKYQNNLNAVRYAIIVQFTTRLSQLMQTLQINSTLEHSMEEQWIQSWSEKVSRVKSAF